RISPPMPPPPADRKTGSGSSGRIFSAIKKHAGAHFEPVLAFRRNKVAKTGAGSFQQSADFGKIRLQVCQSLRVANRHNGKRQSCRDDLAWPFYCDFLTSKHTGDFVWRQRGAKLWIALTHLAKDIAGD